MSKRSHSDSESTDSTIDMQQLLKEDYEDLFRLKCRRWLIENGSQLFYNQLTNMVTKKVPVSNSFTAKQNLNNVK